MVRSPEPGGCLYAKKQTHPTTPLPISIYVATTLKDQLPERNGNVITNNIWWVRISGKTSRTMSAHDHYTLGGQKIVNLNK